MTQGGYLVALANDMTQRGAENLSEGMAIDKRPSMWLEEWRLWATWYKPDLLEGERAEDWVQPYSQ